jgi:hypothetical protein
MLPKVLFFLSDTSPIHYPIIVLVQDIRNLLKTLTKYVLLKANRNEQLLIYFSSDDRRFQPHENKFVFERLRMKQ